VCQYGDLKSIKAVEPPKIKTKTKVIITALEDLIRKKNIWIERV
jgi:hypothetical protein